MSRPPDRNPGIAIGSGHTCDTPSGLPCQACADQYVSTPAPPAAVLDRAVARLRTIISNDDDIVVYGLSKECAAALLAKLEAGERLHQEASAACGIPDRTRIERLTAAVLAYRSPEAP